MNIKKIYTILFLFVTCLAWGQVSEPYLLADFSETELESMLEICHKGGFNVLIQRTPFSTYGHYDWNEAFAPQGGRSVTKMVAEAEAAGVQLGVWVQDNAIGTNDPFFTTEYIKQCRKGVRLELYDGLTADENTIAIRRCDEMKTPSTLNLLLVDDELISYATLEYSGELILIHSLTRGAFGTTAAPHTVDAEAYRLWDSQDHFVEPEGELRHLVRQYLEDKLQYVPVKLYQDDASQEWIDESVRVSQVERWETQGATLPSLGWFMIRATDKRRMGTTMEAMEWMLSKAAAFSTCYGLVIDPQALSNHGMLDDMLETMNRWNRLLRYGALTEQHRQLLRDPYLDWHLEEWDSVRYLLYPQNFSRRLRCSFEEIDPGVLRSETWTWNSEDGGAYGLRVQVDGKVEILNPMVNTNRGLVMFPCALKPGQRLNYDFGETAWVIDENYNKLEEVPVEGLAELDEGNNEVSFLCEIDPAVKERPEVTLRYITRERPVPVTIHGTPNK